MNDNENNVQQNMTTENSSSSQEVNNAETINQNNANNQQQPVQSNKFVLGVLVGCGSSILLAIVLLFFIVGIIFISTPSKAKTDHTSSAESAVSSLVSSAVSTETNPDDTHTDTEKAKKEESKNETSVVSSKTTSSQNSSKAESNSKSTISNTTESKTEVKQQDSNYVLDFDSVQFGEYDITGLTVKDGEIESVIRGGSDNNTLVVKAVLDDESMLNSKCYGIVDELIKKHGFDKGSKIDFWAVNKDGIKVKSFVLDSKYFPSIKNGSINGTMIQSFVSYEYPPALPALF